MPLTILQNNRTPQHSYKNLPPSIPNKYVNVKKYSSPLCTFSADTLRLLLARDSEEQVSVTCMHSFILAHNLFWKVFFMQENIEAIPKTAEAQQKSLQSLYILIWDESTEEVIEKNKYE